MDSIIEISIIIPCFNSGTFLVDAVNSILTQQGSFLIYEILVIDDFSNDVVTIKTLKEIEKHSKVIVISNTKSKGAAGARNTGIYRAKSEWLMFLDSDDMLLDNALEILAGPLNFYRDTNWVGADFKLWHKDGTIDAESFFSTRDIPKNILYNANLHLAGSPILLHKPVEHFLSSSLTAMGVGLLRRSLAIELDGFREDFKMCEDYHFWIRLAQRTDFLFIPVPIMLYRQHDQSTTNRGGPAKYWQIIAFLDLLKRTEFEPYKKILKNRLSEIYVENATYYREKGIRHEAFTGLLKAVWHNFFNKLAWRGIIAVIIKG